MAEFNILYEVDKTKDALLARGMREEYNTVVKLQEEYLDLRKFQTIVCGLTDKLMNEEQEDKDAVLEFLIHYVVS